MSAQHNSFVHDAFESAVRDFKNNIKNNDVYRQILATTSIDDVYDVTDKLQQEQAQKGHLRHLTKIQPFLENLRDYSGAIEVFLQAKPDILALIWGPIKLLLQWACVLKQSFDAIVNTTRDVGTVLPEFKKMVEIFKDNAHIKDLLLLFFKDLLDFYAITLNFFTTDRWKTFFEVLWPRSRDKIKVVVENIDRHTHLLRNEVRLEHIYREHTARVRALEHYEVTEKAHRRQEFQAIKTDISPKSYEAKLDWLRGRVCPGTEKWLVKDDIYTKWLDTLSLTTNLLWLQGIPGAGKTFLSSLIVNETKHLSRTIYAYLSHDQSRGLTALSVLHSLIFQLASDHENLQEILCQSSREDLKSNTDVASNLLISLLNHAGLVYVVVDGLDEIEGFEIARLAKILLNVTEKCTTTRLLISSRAERSIASILKDKPTIRVDDHNTESIQAFVTQREYEWFRDIDCSPDDQKEIKGLLAPLASNSKGMFLYARLVLDNVAMLDGIDDIRAELRVLPESLNEAYGRILHRINNLQPPSLRAKARKLLGWIGCSPIVMTIQEMEQALSIKDVDTNNEARTTSSQSVLRVCAPIVEIVDDYVQFVHFTVKEYLFSPDISGYVCMVESTLRLALCCTTYLGQSHHDIERSDDEIANAIATGSYRLHEFASRMWYNLVVKYTMSSNHPEPDDELIRCLEAFVDRRLDIDDVQQLTPPAPPNIEPFRPASAYLHAFLSHVADFNKIRSDPNTNMDVVTWTESDPTTISAMSVRIHKRAVVLLACTSQKHDDCQCMDIRYHYGSRPYKCTFLNCAFRRHGFETIALLKAHLKNHERTWYCDKPGCEYAKRGFISRNMRDKHQARCQKVDPQHLQPVVVVKDSDNAYELIADLVKSDEIETIKSLRRPFDMFGRPEMRLLLKLAAGEASAQMLKFILDRCIFSDADLFAVLNFAAHEGNSVNFRHIWSIRTPESWFAKDYSELIKSIIESESEELWAEWTEITSQCLDDQTLHSKNVRSFYNFEYSKSLKKSNCAQMLITWWDLLFLRGAFANLRQFDEALYVSAVCGLTEPVQYLLDHGADPDCTASTGPWSPLEVSLGEISARYADITRLLLLYGADPNRHRETMKLTNRDRRGARNIQKWLGITWDELVEEARAHRASLDYESLWDWEKEERVPSTTED